MFDEKEVSDNWILKYKISRIGANEGYAFVVDQEVVPLKTRQTAPFSSKKTGYYGGRKD